MMVLPEEVGGQDRNEPNKGRWLMSLNPCSEVEWDTEETMVGSWYEGKVALRPYLFKRVGAL